MNGQECSDYDMEFASCKHFDVLPVRLAEYSPLQQARSARGWGVSEQDQSGAWMGAAGAVYWTHTVRRHELRRPGRPTAGDGMRALAELRHKVGRGLRALNSWDVLRALFPWQDPPPARLPLARREKVRLLALARIANLMHRVPSMVWVVVVALYVAAVIYSRAAQVPLCLNALLLLLLAPLALFIPSLLVWALPLGLTLAPIIAREREGSTWEVLRATPYSTEEILLTKAHGALRSLRERLWWLWYVQVQGLIASLLIGSGITLVSGALRVSSEAWGSSAQNVVCVATIGLVLAVAAGYLFDRVQQLVLMIVAALAASTGSSSVREAMTAAVTASLLAWGVDVMVGVAVLAIQPVGEVRDVGFSLITMILLGPYAGYMLELNPFVILAAALLTFLARSIAIRRLWTVALRGAEKL